MLFDYLKGRWSQEDIQKYIKFSTVVRDVVYNKATDDFTVSVKDLKNDEVMDGERYDIPQNVRKNEYQTSWGEMKRRRSKV